MWLGRTTTVELLCNGCDENDGGQGRQQRGLGGVCAMGLMLGPRIVRLGR
jgi:hypothetical protein